MLKAVILDDELRGSRLLQHKLQAFDQQLHVEAVFNDPLLALSGIARLKPDVLFLDVEMPILNGFQFLEKLGAFDFEVIFVTAFNAYTVDALRINALDYLLKPVDDDELKCAIDRLQEKLAKKKIFMADFPEPLSGSRRIALPTAEGVYLVKKTDIMRVEAMSNYSTFCLAEGKKIVVSKTLKEFEQLLTDAFFIRISRSVIANLDYVAKYRKGDGGTLEFVDGAEVEVTASRKEALLKSLLL
ncbi:response regulator transcription factor [Sphingobacterium olei]|uniref:Response regulator transcription factor n=2 Tax=Sphingobacterium olei TaxID=2571155 RepID=A0A4U0NZ90_9SPHI|nr:response regulator transcription factor [Sphingobacterium olei]